MQEMALNLAGIWQEFICITPGGAIHRKRHKVIPLGRGRVFSVGRSKFGELFFAHIGKVFTEDVAHVGCWIYVQALAADEDGVEDGGSLSGFGMAYERIEYFRYNSLQPPAHYPIAKAESNSQPTPRIESEQLNFLSTISVHSRNYQVRFDMKASRSSRDIGSSSGFWSSQRRKRSLMASVQALSI